VEETNDMYLDVFSCKSFDKAVVEKVVNDYFKPEKMASQLVMRDAQML
jgi:isocitrate dehydrogenase kinase/phosphatase